MDRPPDTPFASVVIPVWRDAGALAQALRALLPHPDIEIVVAPVWGESDDVAAIRAVRPDVRCADGPRGRGAQMNAGAAAARGAWLVFLHADSKLPPDWVDVVRQAENKPGVVGGAFRLVLDSRDWRARLIEWGVRARVALFGLPYGDQAIFVRRDVFDALGGYRDWPLMEDVDFVRRLASAGRLFVAASPVVTSARRWERDGWLRRSLGNILLTVRFLLGASPARLAQRYLRRPSRAIVMMARAPWLGGKTRLAGLAPDAALDDLRQRLFDDTLDVVRSAAEPAQKIVACEPAAAAERLRAIAGPAIDVIAQHGGDLGERLRHVFEDAFRLGAGSVVVIGSDLPDLPTRLIAQAFDMLDGDSDRVVLGPAEDGGYYLIGMRTPHPTLFAGIEWSSRRVLEETIAAARADQVPFVLLDPWRDVDEPGDIAAFLERSPATTATRTRVWVETHLRSGIT